MKSSIRKAMQVADSSTPAMNGSKPSRLVPVKVTPELYSDLQLLAAERRETPEHFIGGIIEARIAEERLRHARADLPHGASLTELRGCVQFKPEGSVQ